MSRQNHPSHDLGGLNLGGVPEAAIAPQPAAPANILVVDDNPDNLRLLLEILLPRGHRIRPVTDGTLAITAAQLQPPDLVLLDIRMPGLDGYGVCRALKASDRTRPIPIIFLTVLDDTVDKVQGFELGGVDYITKPFDAAELLARVDNQLRLVRLRQQLAERELFLRTVFHGLEAAISVIDVQETGEMRIVTVNETFLTMSGLTRQALEGSDLRNFVPEQIIARHHQRCVDTAQSHTDEAAIVLKGEETWWLSTHTPMLDSQNRVYRLIGTSLNITQRKQAEIKLAERSQELAQTLAELRETQSQLVESAKMAALGKLVAGIAHEINTPLGIAMTAASTLENELRELAKRCYAKPLAEEAWEEDLAVMEECTGLVLGNLARAGELIRSFKQVAVDQTSLQVRSFRVKAYLQEVINSLKPQLKQTPHRISLEGEEVQLCSYPGALSQVVTNLILNSLLHGYLDGRAGLIQLQVQRQGDNCCIQYCDDGLGIDPAHLNQIFEPFFTTARQKGGSGLGLHLVYNLVSQRLKGAIAVTSQPGQGVNFRLTLPLNLPLNLPPARTESPPQRWSNPPGPPKP